MMHPFHRVPYLCVGFLALVARLDRFEVIRNRETNQYLGVLLGNVAEIKPLRRQMVKQLARHLVFEFDVDSAR